MKKSFRKVVIASAVILSAMAFQPHEVKAFDFGGGFGSSFSASDYAPISSNSSSSLSNISTSDYRPISTPSVSESVSSVSSSDYRPISTPSVSESVSNVSSSDYRPISTPSVSESVSSVSSSDYRPISTPSVSESVNNVSSSDYRPISTPSVSESVSNVSSSDYQPISTPSVSESASDVSSSDYRPISTPSVNESVSNVSSNDYQPISTPSVSESVSNVSSSDYRPISTPSVSEDASNIKPSDYKPISDSSVSASGNLADSVDYKAIAGKDDTVTTDSLAKKGKDDALKMADSKVDQSATDALGAVDFTEKALESANAGTQKASTGSSRYNLAVSPEVETALDSLSEEHRNQFIKALKDYGYGLNNSETSATTTPEYSLSSTSSSNKGKLDFTPYGHSTLTDSQGQPTSAYQGLLDLANSKEIRPLFNQSASNDYQIKKGDSLAKIGNLHYPDDKEKAAAASMLALQDLHGQNKLNINNKQNRINLTPGDKVNVDLSNYTSEEIRALAKGFNKIQSAENKIDTFRQAQEEAKALARAQARQDRASQARKIWQEQPTNATSKLSDLLQQNTDSASESKSQKIAKGWANLSAPTKPNRFGQPNYQAGYQEVKNRPTTLEEVMPGALSQFVNKYLLADPSASNKYLAETKVSPKDFSLDAFEKRSKISHEAGKAAFKDYYNDAVTGLASLVDLSFDGMKTTAHKAGLVNLSKDELNEIYNRDSAVWQGIVDKWDSTSAPEMLLGVSRYVMNLASQVSPGSREINSISNFMTGDGLAQKNQLKTTLEAAEFALPASKASIAGKIAKNGVGSAAHAIASKTGKVLNTAEGFGKNLFDATKSKVNNFGEKWFPQPSMVTPEGLVLDVSKPSHSKSAPAYLSKKTDSNLGLTNNKDGVGGKGGFSQELSTHADNKKVNQLAGKTFDSNETRRYITDIQRITNRKIPTNQIAELKNALRTTEYKKLPTAEVNNHRKEFNKVTNKLIEEWELNTNQTWPRYTENVYSKDGKRILRRAGEKYDAHHLIENSYGGDNKWWNIHPAKFPNEHQSGIHRSGGPSRKLFKK